MPRPICVVVLLAVCWASFSSGDSGADSRGLADPLAAWGDDVEVRLVSTVEKRHVIHSYFNTTPESPDGRWVVYYSSPTSDGHVGDIRVLERATGGEKVVATRVTVEDAHRAACQQWVSKGRRILFHNFRDGDWIVESVDVETLERQVLARGRQLAWGQPDDDVVPLYGPHSDPGGFQDLELLNVKTGDRQTVLTIKKVREQFPEWFEKHFPKTRTSIFFPILSPDLERVLFKIASPAGGHFRSREASVRKGLVDYDLKASRFLFIHDNWGHPAWHPDSRQIMNVGPILIDDETGNTLSIPGFPKFRGSHPSVSPDGRLFVTEAGFGERPQPGRTWSEYSIVVGDIHGRHYKTIHRFRHAGGAESWRPAHPHPAFSPDGRRIYFNVSSSEWTRLYVAERSE